MRTIPAIRLASILALSLLGSAADAQSDAPSARPGDAPPNAPALAMLSGIRDIAISASDPAALVTALQQRASSVPGATVEGPTGRAHTVTLRIAPGVPVTDAIRRFGWRLAFAVSSDPHGQRWHVALFRRDTWIGPPRRIEADTPRMGGWEIRLVLDGRPHGAQPNVFSGISPAYDVQRYPAQIVAIEFVRSVG